MNVRKLMPLAAALGLLTMAVPVLAAPAEEAPALATPSDDGCATDPSFDFAADDLEAPVSAVPRADADEPLWLASRGGTCSGDQCGCFADSCAEQCPVGDNVCMGNCRREQKQCAICCCCLHSCPLYC